MAYYFDTCVWRDHYEDRFGIGGRPLGKIATRAFVKLMREGKPILFSDFVIREMTRDYSEEDILRVFDLLFVAGKLRKIRIAKEDVEEARVLSRTLKVAFGDCLHAVLARNNDAILVT